jgi:hypothetical protein
MNDHEALVSLFTQLRASTSKWMQRNYRLHSQMLLLAAMNYCAWVVYVCCKDRKDHALTMQRLFEGAKLALDDFVVQNEAKSK